MFKIIKKTKHNGCPCVHYIDIKNKHYEKLLFIFSKKSC